MDLLAAEANIVTRLQASITGVQIKSFPENPVQFFQVLPPNGAILVRYNRSTYSEPELNRGKTVRQWRTIEWIVHVALRNLYTHTGIYTRLEEVREALTGYTITSEGHKEISVLRPVSDEFIERDDTIWHHQIIFQHTIETTEDFQ